MDSAEATAVVEVIAENSTVDASSVNTNATLDTEQITAVPLVSRNFADVVQLTPGVPANAQGYRDAVQGARGIMNNFMMDGTSYNSKFNGEQRGGTRIPFAFGLESVKEIQVITNPFDVQYGDASGGIINAITKGGTNEISGMLLTQIRPSSLVALLKPVPYDPNGNVNTVQGRTTNYDNREYAFNVGGPLIKDKLFYFVNVDYVHMSQNNQPKLGAASDSATDANAAWPTWIGATGMGQMVSASNKGLSLLQEASAPWTNDEKHMTAMARIDWNVNADHRASFRVNYQNYKGLNDIWAGSFKTTEAESNNSSIKYQTLSWVAELNSILSEGLINQALVQISNERRPETPNSTVSPEIDLPSFYAGNYYIDPRDTDENTVQIIDNATYIKNDWTVKAGIDWQSLNYRNTFFQYGHGAWAFKSFSAANQWFSGVFNSPNTITYQQAWSNTNGFVKFGERILANYLSVQNNTFFNHRLTLTGGIRYTREIYDSNPNPNPKVQGLDQMPDNGSWDPRVGFAYDLKGDNKTVIRGGVGLFSISNPAQNVASAFLQNGQNTLPYKVSYSTANAALFQPGGALSAQALYNPTTHNLGILDPNSLSKTLPSGSIQVTLMDPEAKMSKSRNWQLGIEHAFDNGLTLKARGVYKTFYHLQYFMDINLGQVVPGTKGTDASVYYNDGYPYQTNLFTDASNSTTPRPGHAVVRGRSLDLSGYGSVGLSKWDGKGFYRAFIVEAEQHLPNGFGYMANITLSKSVDSNSNERSTAQAVASNPMNPAQPIRMATSDNDVPVVGNLLVMGPKIWDIRSSLRFTYTSGFPYTPRYYADVNADGYNNDPALDGRNSMRQPYRKQLDLQIGRAWPVAKGVKVDTTIQVFNPFNWANQTTGGTVVDAALDKNGVSPFQKISNPDAKSRQVQGTLKLTF
jgi:hypothetical protein